MARIVPPSAPKISKEDLVKIVTETFSDAELPKCFLVGMRGYYRNSLGHGENERGIYDDGFALFGANHFSTYNGNCDPGAFRKHIANLKPGRWLYKIGIHGLSKPVAQRYKALVQAAPVTVIRDNEGADTGYFGINIHCGGYNTTSSIGCQTVFPDQWPAFIAAVKDQMVRAGQETIPYLLIELT
jgi:hypothetical protein